LRRRLNGDRSDILMNIENSVHIRTSVRICIFSNKARCTNHTDCFQPLQFFFILGSLQHDRVIQLARLFSQRLEFLSINITSFQSTRIVCMFNIPNIFQFVFFFKCDLRYRLVSNRNSATQTLNKCFVDRRVNHEVNHILPLR